MFNLKDLIAKIAEILLIPTLVLLAASFGWVCVMLGTFTREAIERRRAAATWDRVLGAGVTGAPPLVPGTRGRFLGVLHERGADELYIEKYLLDAQSSLTRVVERASLASKIGPMLGLMGTLIPLGPALQSMSTGSVAALSENLIVAFGTTVVGLAVAGPAFWIASVRRRWYEHDLADMEFVWRRTAGIPEGTS